MSMQLSFDHVIGFKSEMLFQITEILNAQKLDVNANNSSNDGGGGNAGSEKGDQEKSVPEKDDFVRQKSPEKSPEVSSPSAVKGSYFDRVAQRKKNWEYFEINHPKAISDQRLQQLKAKYQKKRADGDFEGQPSMNPVAENEEEAAESRDKVEPVHMR